MKNLARLVIFLSIITPLFYGCNTSKEDESKYSGELFNENIRSTGPRTPEEELAGLRVPPGFKIQLFASEPDIDKPINMTFDAKGRMWVTQSFEYPFPSLPGKKSTDRLTILEDTDHDGKADRFTEVADTLNIPIGVLPLTDGVIAFSVPNLYRYTDSDHNDKPEKSRFLFGPFGFKDTHGMVSNLIRGFDGWVHACHGFTNLSKIAGTDGDSVIMESGNTFRFRLDGSRVEQSTFGQVNPFGLAYDERGYIYSTDSHSSPLHQLIHGGDYPHFGKQEIMAFGPDMKSLENEATALCGIAYYGDIKFPAEFQKNFFIGDAVRSRVHRYTWVLKGSSPVGKSETDFVMSADPWFRPVNIKMGPDGAIYVADFYNAIIGHYEAPLNHPKRDKKRGRIWRITYQGEQNENKDLSAASLEDLLTTLNIENMTVRMNAADQIADRIGASAVPALRNMLANQNTTARQYSHILWLLFRLDGLDDEILKKAIAHSDPLIRLHAFRILAEGTPQADQYYPIALAGLKDQDPHVQRAAVELLMKFSNLSSVEAVLALLNVAPASDTHLVYTSRLCLRNLLRHSDVMKQVAARNWSPADAGWIAGTLVDVYSPEAAGFLSKFLINGKLPGEKMWLAYQEIARYIPESQLNDVITKARQRKDDDVDVQAYVFRGIHDGLLQRGSGNPDRLKDWGTSIAESLLKRYSASSQDEQIVRKQLFAIGIAGDLKVASTEPVLEKFVLAPDTSGDRGVKYAAIKSLLIIAPEKSIEILGSIVRDTTRDISYRKRAGTALAEVPGTAVNKVLSSISIRNTPPDLESVIITALAGSSEGKDFVLKGVREGNIRTRTLIDPRVAERMMINANPKQRKDYEALTANIDPVDTKRQTLIDERLKAFNQFKSTNVQVDSGQMVFQKNCAVCHRQHRESGIGPPLAGVGKRGPEALAEKILDPNRNISEAFRNYTITLRNGKILTGLFRREQGEVIVFGDLNGNEFQIPKKDIAEKKASRYTIMPDHFGTTLSQDEFNKLLSYLLNW